MQLFRRKNIVKKLVDSLVEANRFDEIEARLGGFNPRRLSESDRECWHHMRGITAMRRGDRKLAFERFLRGYAECPSSQLIAFSLAQEYEARGEPNRMRELLRRCSYPIIPSNYALAGARYCYLWGFHDDGLKLLEPIVACYFELKIADDHFLYIRGMPFLSQTWNYMLCFCCLKEDYSRIESFTRRIRTELSDCDPHSFEQYLGCVRGGSFDEEIITLELRLEKDDASFPQGYDKVQLASLKALQTTDAEQALRILDAVVIEDGDFPWLSDVLLLHRARIASKVFGANREGKLLAEFFENQGMLFEPDHAISFQLVAYQEQIKSRYQRSRGG